jgi:hypothetical protein
MPWTDFGLRTGLEKGVHTQGADPPPLPLHVGTGGKNHLNEKITPSSPLGLARDIAKPYQI